MAASEAVRSARRPAHRCGLRSGRGGRAGHDALLNRCRGRPQSRSGRRTAAHMPVRRIPTTPRHGAMDSAVSAPPAARSPRGRRRSVSQRVGLAGRADRRLRWRATLSAWVMTSPNAAVRRAGGPAGSLLSDRAGTRAMTSSPTPPRVECDAVQLSRNRTGFGLDGDRSMSPAATTQEFASGRTVGHRLKVTGAVVRMPREAGPATGDHPSSPGHRPRRRRRARPR
jgi:hypothetical protein